MTLIIGAQPLRFLAVGDSKTYVWGNTVPLNYAYEVTLARSRGCYRAGGHLAHSGYTTAQLADAIDADIAAYSGITPTSVLLNIGVNDGAVSDADLRADYGYIADALHTRWTGITVYCARVWRRSISFANLDDVIIPQVISTRPWCALGIDERTVLEGGDDGVTNTSDGIHPNAAGYLAWAAAWAALL